MDEGRTVLRAIERLVKPLKVQLRNVITRGVVEGDLGSGNAFAGRGGALLKVLGFAGKVKEPVEHFQPVGYLCIPDGGAEALIANLQSDSTMPVAVVVMDRRHIPARAPGATEDFGPLEPVLHTGEGNVVFHGKGQEAWLSGADESDPDGTLAPLATLVVTELNKLRQEVSDKLGEMRSVFDQHTHMYAPGPGTPVPSATPVPFHGEQPDLPAAGDVACKRTHIA